MAELGLSVLLIEDNLGDSRLIRHMLREVPMGASPVRLTCAERLESGLKQLSEEGADVVLLDLSLPDSQGLDTFTRVHEAAPSVPIVVLSGLRDEDLAIRAVHEGAQDYLVKGQVDGQLLIRALRYAVERKRLEQERADLDRQKSEFFTNISHDLRTPLAAIKASAGVLLANEPPGLIPPLRRMLQNIDAAADEMSTLVEDLLELTRLRAGRVELWRVRQDVGALVKLAMGRMEALARQRNQQLHVVLPDQPVMVDLDGERFGRVLMNLLGNAHKYGREDGHIRARVQDRGGEVLVSVADDGPGLAATEHERIFDRFYRSSDESGLRQPGSGLGLPIARALVELHGGRIWVESESGQGATFWVAIPAAAEAT